MFLAFTSIIYALFHSDALFTINLFSAPSSLTASNPQLLNLTATPLSTEYNLCNLSQTPSMR